MPLSNQFSQPFARHLLSDAACLRFPGGFLLFSITTWVAKISHLFSGTLDIDRMSFIAVAHAMENGTFIVYDTASYFIEVIRKFLAPGEHGPSNEATLSLIYNGVNCQLQEFMCRYALYAATS